jgi:CHRD domain-containing protein
VRLRLILLLAAIAVAVPAVALASRSGSSKFEAYLLGKSEIPKAAAKGKGTAKITITGNKVCWKFISVGGIDKPVVSHIHKGGATTSGPVVVPLGGAFKTTGCVTSTAAVVKAIEKNPKGYYVNIHTAKYPNGAIRGQLHAGD